MPKRIVALHEYISAHDAAILLSSKLGRPVNPKYIRRLSKRARNPVRTETINNRFLYLKADIESIIVRQRKPR